MSLSLSLSFSKSLFRKGLGHLWAAPANGLPKTSILRSHWSVHTCQSYLITVNQSHSINDDSPTILHSDWTILIGPVNQMTSQGDLHKFWTNQRPSFVPRHTLLLLPFQPQFHHFSEILGSNFLCLQSKPHSRLRNC